MLSYWIFGALITLIGVVMSFLPVVSSLPFGADAILAQFVGVIHGLVEELPFLYVVMNVVLGMVVVKFALFSFHWIKWVIERVH